MRKARPLPQGYVLGTSSSGGASRGHRATARHLVVFPNGTHDVMGEPKTPEVGDKLTADGQQWLVLRVAKNNSGSSVTVTLRLDGTSAQVPQTCWLCNGKGTMIGGGTCANCEGVGERRRQLGVAPVALSDV